MIPVVADTGAPFVVMHWRGLLKDGNVKGTYADVVTEVVDELHARVDAVLDGGIAPDRVIVDPGLGFSKDAEHDLVLLAHLDRLLTLGHPSSSPPPANASSAASSPARTPPRPRARARRGHRRGLRARRAGRRVGGPRPRGPRHGRRRPRRPRRRRSPVNAPHLDVEQVEAANTAFYEALEEGDFEKVSEFWLTPSDLGVDESYHDPADAGVVSCVHPGWPVLTGRGEVLRSYALIMANTDYIQFFLTDVHVSVTGDTALVTCTENILSGGPAPDGGEELGPLVGQLVVATNTFRRTPAGWKLWSHHASPVLAETEDEDGEDTPPDPPDGHRHPAPGTRDQPPGTGDRGPRNREVVGITDRRVGAATSP